MRVPCPYGLAKVLNFDLGCWPSSPALLISTAPSSADDTPHEAGRPLTPSTPQQSESRPEPSLRLGSSTLRIPLEPICVFYLQASHPWSRTDDAAALRGPRLGYVADAL